MKLANIAEFKNQISKFISFVEHGEEVIICRRNVPVARIVPATSTKWANKTRLGSGAGSVKVKTDLTEPVFSPDDWQMLTGDP